MDAARISRIHLLPALAAMAFAALALAAVTACVLARLPSRMPFFATVVSPVKLTGNVLQSEAFTTPGILPVYGSSELDREAGNRPDEFFRQRPTGFEAFPIGRGGTTCLMILQKLAAAGSVVRGKKVVIILSPAWFSKEEVGENAVDANLTAPQLGAWIFDGTLSLALKEKIARRLDDYPDSLDDQPALVAALNCLANPGRASRILYAALLPIGLAQNVLFKQLECCALLREMLVFPHRPRKHPLKESDLIRDEHHKLVNIDWERLARDAETRDRKSSTGTSYSAHIDASRPEGQRQKRPAARGSRDAQFIAKLAGSKEWEDLQLLIETLRELGADAMFLSQPFNGLYKDEQGTTPEGRRAYYARLPGIFARSPYPLRDFSEHEEDRFFFNDTGHPSAKAWIYYDRALDEFYHGVQN